MDLAAREKLIEPVALVMARADLRGITQHPLPEGYGFHTFRRGDEEAWAEVSAASGLFDSIQGARERFAQEFAPHPDELESRCFFVVHEESGCIAGTATAWFDPDFQGADYGRIHWVGVHTGFQGNGLGKALVARVMERLAESHERAYLRTQADRLRAIKMYLDFGFEPLPVSKTCERGWRMVAEEIDYPVLERFRVRQEGRTK